MSTEFEIFVRFPEARDPVERFVEIASRFEATGNYGNLFNLYVVDFEASKLISGSQSRKGKYRHPNPIDHTVFRRPEDRWSGDTIPTKDIPHLLQLYYGESLMCEGRWEILKRYDSMGEVKSSWIELTTVGRTSRWTLASYHGADVAYEAGSNHTISSPENAMAMAQEATLFIEMGAEKMWGYNGNQTSDPRTSFLCYHRDPDQYRNDLRHVSDKDEFSYLADYEQMRPITNEDVLLAALSSEERNIDFVETNVGPVVYCSTIYGGLGAFYEALYESVLSESG
jgi:hypothetical protein